MGATVGEKLKQIKASLEAAGDESAALDAVLLLAGAENVSENFARLHPEAALKNEAVLNGYVARRLKREPVSKILRVKGFWKDDFYVDENVLDPRPDSETLVESVLKRFPDRRAALRILDLGTGSGCLVLSLLREYENAHGVGVDISGKALAVACKNADLLGLSDRFAPVCADWEQPDFAARFDGAFDVVVANPPYIDASEELPPDTLFDPPQALFAAENGLKAYKDIAARLSGLLAQDGEAFFECGYTQARAVSEILTAHGFVAAGVDKDLAGVDRCVRARKAKKES